MSVPEPSISIDEQADGFVRVNMTYPQDFIIELARRAEENICEEVLARLGYVKVVRCKDCRTANTGNAKPELGEPIWCRYFGQYVNPNGYCVWGERKEDE